MRISDWSSDVCSSDLRRRLAYASQPYSGSLAKRAASTGWPRSAALIASAIELFAEDDSACAVPAATRQASAKTRVRRLEIGIAHIDRKRVVHGKRVSVRVDSGGLCTLKKKTNYSY